MAAEQFLVRTIVAKSSSRTSDDDSEDNGHGKNCCNNKITFKQRTTVDQSELISVTMSMEDFIEDLTHLLQNCKYNIRG